MRYILLVLLAFVTTFASAQVQFLGSPTTTVRNRGNFVSDSLFYLPKRQKLPSDTGALRYQISDSALYVWTGSAWRSTGTAGSAITGSGVAGYMPEFTTSTNLDTTRLYHNAGRFAIGSTTTTNGVFNVYGGQSYMDSTLKIGNGELIVGSTSSASRKLYVTSNSDVARFEQTASDKNMVIELRHTNPNASGTIREEGINFLSPNTSTRGRITFYPSDTFNVRNYLAFFTPSGSGTNAERMRIANDGEVLIGTTSDAGAYALQVAGSIYNTTGAVLAASSGNVGIGVIATAYKLDVRGSGYFEKTDTIGSASLVVRGKSDLPDYGSSGSGILSLRDVEAAGYGNLNIGAYRNAPYGTYFQVDQGSGTQPILLNPLGGDIIINSNNDAGAYALQVAGSIYNTTGAVLSVSSGSVGIGTASPDASFKLDTRGVTRLAGNVFFGISSSTNSRLYILNATNDNRGEIYFDGTNNRFAISSTYGGSGSYQPLDLMTGDATAMRIKADGEVLIGTTTDAGAYALQVAGSIYNTTGAVLAASSGNVGIGTTSPGANLDVSMQGTQGSGQNTRTIRISGAGDDASVLEFFNAWTGNAFVRAKITSDGDGTSQAYGTLKFFTTQNSSVGTTERMRISSGGNVGIGTTTPSQPLHVNGNILTAAPSGGTAKPFKIGEAATVSPTSPNRTIRVEIDGTVYYLHAKTTND